MNNISWSVLVVIFAFALFWMVTVVIIKLGVQATEKSTMTAYYQGYEQGCKDTQHILKYRDGKVQIAWFDNISTLRSVHRITQNIIESGELHNGQKLTVEQMTYIFDRCLLVTY